MVFDTATRVRSYGPIAQWLERTPDKGEVGSSTLPRPTTDAIDCSIRGRSDTFGAVAQLGERRLCKPEVVGSIPISSTNVHDAELS